MEVKQRAAAALLWRDMPNGVPVKSLFTNVELRPLLCRRQLAGRLSRLFYRLAQRRAACEILPDKSCGAQNKGKGPGLNTRHRINSPKF